jgi:hypothetical protein
MAEAVPFGHPAQQLEARRQQVLQAQQIAGGVFRVVGRIELTGPGGTVLPVTFPVQFLEKPSFSFGPELGPAQPVIPSNLPGATAVVRDWSFIKRSDTGVRFYNGASLLIVTQGPADQLMIVNYQFEGRALRSPIS